MVTKQGYCAHMWFGSVYHRNAVLVNVCDDCKGFQIGKGEPNA